MKRYFYLTMITIAAVGGIFIFFRDKAKAPTTENTSKETNNLEEKTMSNLQFPGVLPEEKINNKKAIIQTDKGTIEFELYANKAPKSVSNFVYLAENKFYDGLTFHRVVNDFVIQGGDPSGNGTSGPGYNWEDEDVVGEYLKGTVAMANAGPDTNGSQFFICLEDLPSLPKDYNLFGQVTKGLDVIEKIEVNDKMNSVTIADL